MSLFYRVAYLLGFTPWEAAAQHGPTAELISGLLDRETADRPAGRRRAVDLGCGTGHWSRELARRGWDVTGVDLVPRAIETARRRSEATGLSPRFVVGDVTRLRESGITGPVEFFWDFGVLHGLRPNEWQAVAQEVTAIAAPDASMIVMAWSPGKRGPLPRGASREQIQSAFAGWTVAEQGRADPDSLPRQLRKVDPRWYRLTRNGQPASSTPHSP